MRRNLIMLGIFKKLKEKEDEIERQDKQYLNLQRLISELKNKNKKLNKEVEYLREANSKYLGSIRELRKEIRNLKRGK